MSKILIVGAGPLGMMTALALSNLDKEIVLIGPDAPKDGRTTAILNQGIQFLEEIHVWQKLAGKTAPMQFMRIADGTKRLIRAPEAHFDASEIGFESFGHNIENKDLLLALDEEISQNNAIERIKKPVIDVEIEEKRVVLTLDDNTSIEGAFVVASDGRKSLLREKAGIQTTSWAYPQTALVTNLLHTKEHQATSTEFHTENGPFTLVPLTGNASSLVWVDKPEKITKLMELSNAELQEQISKKAHYILGDMEIITKPMAYPLSGLLAKSFGKGPVVLVGESAHVFPPIGAQGMNLGIRDILSLKKQFQKPHDTYTSLSGAYSKDRKADVEVRTRAVDALNRTLLSGMLPVHIMRGLGLYALNTIPVLRKFVMKQGLGAVHQ